jgi:hypothetical protein
MPSFKNAKIARIFNAAAARNIAANQVDTNEDEDVETLSTSIEPVTPTVDLSSESELNSCRGYDTNSSTKEIFKKLEIEVERKITNGDDVHEDYKPTRKRQRYRGSLKVYDNISDMDILQKYAFTNRTGSKMYTFEVCVF